MSYIIGCEGIIMVVEKILIVGTRVIQTLCVVKPLFYHCLARNDRYVTYCKLSSSIAEYTRNRIQKHLKQRKQVKAQKVLQIYYSATQYRCLHVLY